MDLAAATPELQGDADAAECPERIDSNGREAFQDPNAWAIRGFSTGSDQCTIRYGWWSLDHGKGTTWDPRDLNIGDIGSAENIVVKKPGDPCCFAGGGWVFRRDPQVFLVQVGPNASFVFLDEAQANRVADAFRHAYALCK
jgi:hypothetical protein